MDLLVTGGAGFIGSHVCRAIRRSGPSGRLVVLDDLSTGSAGNVADLEDVEFVEGSILNEDLLSKLVAEADAVVHLAAIPAVARSVKDPRASHDTNATGTLMVLEAARVQGAYVVVASSSSVYGRDVTMPTREDHPTRPASPYAASKLAAESYALAYARSFRLPVLVFRFFNVFGPLQRADHAYAAVIPAFVSAALAGRPLTIHGDGTQTRDFTYVGDVAAVIADALARRVTVDHPLNLAFGSRTSLLSLVSELETLLGAPVVRRHESPRPGDVHDSQADPTQLRGHFPEIVATPLRLGLKSTVEWFSAAGLSVTTASDGGMPHSQLIAHP
jgi:UDP-glucose 4-epimerase